MSDPRVTMPGMNAAAVLLAVLTLAAGFAAGWAMARTRTADAHAEREAARAGRDAARTETAQVRAERDALTAELRAAQAKAAEATARLDSERAASGDKIALLQDAQSKLKEMFAVASQDALRKNNEQFLELADARLKQAGAPLAETLTKVETQMREMEKERVGAQQALAQQIEFVRKSGDELRQETQSLVSALRKPQTRGRWGELQLRRCVEYAGMTDRCDFTEQTSVTTAEGVLRPDMVVKLVGGKSIVVDSKVTPAAYLEAHDAVSDVVREERLAAHARHLRQHVEQLAAKAYWAQFSPSPEFVVLFVPGDPFLAAALEREPNIIDEAFSKRVHIATPTTLISVLRTCAYAWQQEALAENAREVFDLGRELYKRLGTLGGHVDKLGRSLTGAVNDYNKTVGSLESRVLPQARKLKELKVVEDDLVAPRPIEEAVRPIAATELVAAADEDRHVVALPGGEAAIEIDRPEDYGPVTDDERGGYTRATG